MKRVGRQRTASKSPRLFRVVVQVSGLKKASAFYSRLLGVPGRFVGGGRVYFDCGPVILALLDKQKKPKPNPDDLYFAVSDLEKVHARARRLRCLSKLEVHGQSAADIAVRPWGERSFYAQDPFGNGLCFVDHESLFTGTSTGETKRRTGTPSVAGERPALSRFSGHSLVDERFCGKA